MTERSEKVVPTQLRECSTSQMAGAAQPLDMADSPDGTCSRGARARQKGHHVTLWPSPWGIPENALGTTGVDGGSSCYAAWLPGGQ